MNGSLKMKHQNHSFNEGWQHNILKQSLHTKLGEGLNNSVALIKSPSKLSINKTNPKPSICEEYRQEIHLVHQVHTHVFGKRDTSGDVVCLLTQLTYSRLHMLQQIAEQWPGKYDLVYYRCRGQKSNGKIRIRMLTLHYSGYW